jgi:SAM-dependent methyltransferase
MAIDDISPDGAPRAGRERPADPETHARRARSFGSQAAAYAAYRPDYPEAGVRWVLEPALGGRAADTVLDVLDLGAGTGKLTGGLVALGHRVTAVEPDPAMLAQLRALLPGVTALAGGAEDIPLPDASVDAVVVGQALHWFDQERALPEIARVLRPGGVLGALWNFDDDRVEWVAELGRLMREGGRAYVQWTAVDGIAAHPSFGAVGTARFAHRQRSDAESLVATLATHSGMLVLDAPERHVALSRVREFLLSRPETAQSPFDLPLRTHIQRTTRL